MERGVPKGIKEWTQVESIGFEEEIFHNFAGKEVKVSAHLEVKRPIFNDGYMGRPILELTLQKDRWSFHFRIPREGDDEAEKALAVMQSVLRKKEHGFTVYDRVFKAYEAEREAEKAQRIAEHNEYVKRQTKGRGDAKAGSGLGQYSKPGKTKRHRNKVRDQPKR